MDGARAAAYSRALSLQVEVLWRHELPVIAAVPEFALASTVLDVGAGNGAMGRRLAAAFPDKRFLGIEPDAAVHEAGSRSPSPPNYRYVHAGLESVDGEFDLLFARLVVMYVPDRAALYAWAGRNARAALVVNAEDALVTMTPEAPLVMAACAEGLRTRAHELRSTVGGRRDLAAMPAEWAAAGFAPAGSATLAFDVSRPEDRRIVHHIGRLFVEIGNPDAISLPLLNELYEWSVDPAARASYGMAYHRFRNLAAVGAEPAREAAG